MNSQRFRRSGRPAEDRVGLGRRGWIGGALGVIGTAACGGKPKTPLAHLYGQGWVVGSYEFYGEEYADLERSTQQQSFDAYRNLATRGITALDGLQEREVPFYIRSREQAFSIERDVPERLTFTADMDETAREAATQIWEKARAAIHTDYEEIQRLNASLTQLLAQLTKVQSADVATQEEQFRRVRQLEELESDAEVPFELPFEVTRADYRDVLLLLLDRLELEKERLRALEGAMTAVGLIARSTDAGSLSLASNIRKVLVAVDEDAAAAGNVDTKYPADQATRDAQKQRGQKLYAEIRVSPEYQEFLARERQSALEQVGAVFAVIDQFTGLSTHTAFMTTAKIFSGDADYFDYLKLAASVAPAGTGVADVLKTAVDRTGELREVAAQADFVAEVMRSEDPHLELSQMVVNTKTRDARKEVARQLVLFESSEEVEATKQALQASSLLR